MTKSLGSPSHRAKRRAITSRTVLEISRRVSAAIGKEFFEGIAKHLTKLLNADCVLLGELSGGHMEIVRTIGAHMDGHPVSFQFGLVGSASAPLALGKACQCHKDAQRRYPSDQLLAQIGAQAILGLPLLNPQGQTIGLIMALYRRAVVDLRLAREMLRFFSERAAAELNRKRQEDELRERDQRHRAFIAKSSDALWRIEFEQPIDTRTSVAEQLAALYRYGYVAECNDALARLVGMEKADQVIGLRLEDVAPQSEPGNREAALLGIQTGYACSTVELTRQLAIGKRHLLRSQWGVVEDGKLERIWGTTRDITDLKLSAQALDASERRMSDLLETMKLAVVMEDPDGAVTYSNRHFQRTTGWRMADIEGKSWIEVMVPVEERHKLRELFQLAKSNPETPIHFDGTLVGPDAQTWQFEWDRTSLRDRDGLVVAWANIGRDITERKILETQLRHAQILGVVGNLAAGLAHDFNNLLTVVLGYSSRLLDDPVLSPSAYSALAEIRKAAEEGAEITKRLLAVGRRQFLLPKVISVNSLLADSRQMLQTLVGDHIHVQMNLSAPSGRVHIDPHSFHQVLLNLAANARDAMPSGGMLTITTAKASPSERKSEGMPSGEYLLVTVSDTGGGMTKEVREHLFEPFFSTKPLGKGTGLGLSTAYSVVQQSGGHILVDTELGAGTTFRIYLPLVHAEVQQEAPPEQAAIVGRGAETILLVEDRAEIRDVVASMLRDLGYVVLEAEGASTALDFVRDANYNIDLLVTDVAMPGMNGFELAELIRKHRSEVKTLFVSGYLDEGLMPEAQCPDCAYLQKPFTPHALAARIRELLDRSSVPVAALTP